MADASYVQSSFLGGQWSSWMQGRIDDQRYPTAMAMCSNGYPVEEGSWTRRQGFMHLGYTYSGLPGRVINFDFTETTPYMIELTNENLRLWYGTELVGSNDATAVASISTDSPALLTLAAPVTWANGDQIQFAFESASDPSQSALLRARVFTITYVSTTQFTLTDSVTGDDLDGASVGFNPSNVSLTAVRILPTGTPYQETDLPLIRPVQTEGFMVLCHNSYQPQVLTADPLASSTSSPQFRTFTFSPAQFTDGPYLDAVTGAQATTSALSGVCEITISYAAWDSTTPYAVGTYVTYNLADWICIVENVDEEPSTSSTYWTQEGAGSSIGPNGFQSTDVGRQMRFFVEPPPWDSTTNYVTGNSATYNDVAYTALSDNTGEEPDVSPTYWQVNTQVMYWTWGIITSIVNANTAEVQIMGDPFINTVNIIYEWLLGVYSDTSGWPSCGVFQGGRLWLAGAVPNRVDASMSDEYFTFSPTLVDGTVTDACAIEAEMTDISTDPIYWMHNIGEGIMAETKSGEWVIQASATNDPITPTTIDPRKMTRYGGANILPAQAGISTLFIQKFGKSCMEYLEDVFTGRFIAPNLSETARDIGSLGFAELAYQCEATPIMWARMDNGTLAGMSFRRISSFATEKPAFAGWHVHVLGSGNTILSICTAGNVDGTMDALNMVTQEANSGPCHVERLTDLFEPGAPLTTAWFLDNATTPTGVLTSTQDGVDGITLYGLWYLNGKEIAVWAGGLDCGNYTPANGQVFVPFESDPGGLFTSSYFSGLFTGSYPYGAPATEIVTTTAPTASLTPFTIQGYYGSAAASDASISLVDWGENIILNQTAKNADLETMTITEYNLTTGAIVAVGTGLPVVSAALDDMGCIINGYYYYCTNSGDASPIYQYSLSTLTLENSAGAAGGVVDVWQGTNGANSPSAFPTMNQMVGVFATGNFLIGVAALAQTVGVVSADTLEYLGYYYDPTEQQALLVPGAQNANSAVVYILGNWDTTVPTETHLYALTISNGAQDYLTTPSTWSSTQLYLPGTVVVYEGMQYTAIYNGNNANLDQIPSSNVGTYWDLTQNPYISTTQLNAITPQDVASNWTAFELDEGCQWLLYDASDGNVITLFRSSVLDTDWVVKISTANGNVLWSVPFTHEALCPEDQNSRILNGSLFLYESGSESPRTAYVMDTATGSYETYSIAGVIEFDNSFVLSDDQSGSVYLLSGEYLPNDDDAPTPINGTPSGGYEGLLTQLNPGNLMTPTTSTQTSGTVPIVVGFPYTSQGQILRAVNPQLAGSRNGPAFAKTRRTHMFGAMVENSVTGSVVFGTDFTNTYPADYQYDDGTAYSTLTPFTGIWWDTLNDSYSFNSQPCWEVTRPYPLTVNAIGAFLHTQDR